jgi:hypothetical protein
MMKRLCVSGALALAAALALTGAGLQADPLTCNLSGYKGQPGLTAAVEQDTLAVTWEGDKGSELRMGLAIDAGQPIVRELAVRRKGGQWATLGSNLKPEFNVTTGKRRMTNQQLNPLRWLGVEITPEVIERDKWFAFWDAPLVIPGAPNTNPDSPRSANEIGHAAATFKTTSCEVKTDGGRLEIAFPGLSMGLFAGRLQFTVFKGTNLVRQEAIAKTDAPSVAYKYSGGLKGFSTASQRVRWRDTGGDWQKYEFGGSPNTEPVPLRARNRIATIEGQSGSVSFFPPPHKFFFSRETEINLGFVYYRKDDENTFSAGVRHGDRDDVFRVIGRENEWIDRRVAQGRQFAQGNFALYNARPGTWQRMAVYVYLSPENATAAAESVLAFTNGDRYRPLTGYQTMITHIHPPFTMELTDAGTLDRQPPWIPAIRARGVNIVAMSDFHADGHMTDPGPIRLAEQQRYFEASRRHSDKEFLILPFEEPHDYVGGHWNTFFPKPVYWTHVRQEGQPLVEQHPQYGKVYHVGSIDDVLEMAKAENGFFYVAHQRTKGSMGMLDLYTRKQPYFRTEYFLGAEYRANVPTDLSEKRMLEVPGLDAMDDMNNWSADAGIRPKYIIAASDTYMKFPEDDIYPESFVTYVKLDRLPKFDEDWTPIVRSMRTGEFFVSSGEVLLKQFTVAGAGAQRRVSFEFDWTFPLDFVEVVWGDGQKTDRQIISATDLPPFGSKRFSVPLDATGKNWVRVAAWDNAGNGAFSMPVRLSTTTSNASR